MTPYTTPDSLIIGDIIQPEIFWLTQSETDLLPDYTDTTLDGADITIEGGANVTSGNGDDFIVIYDLNGQNNNAIIHSGAGDDDITTNSGDDTIYAGSGDDMIASGTGNDIIYAGSGNDTITIDDSAIVLAGDGDDDISLGEGTSFVIGGRGDDVISCLTGQQTMVFDGQSGSDIVNSANAGDVLQFSLQVGQHVSYQAVDNGYQMNLFHFTVSDDHGQTLSTVSIDIVGSGFAQAGDSFTII